MIIGLNKDCNGNGLYSLLVPYIPLHSFFLPELHQDCNGIEDCVWIGKIVGGGGGVDDGLFGCVVYRP